MQHTKMYPVVATAKRRCPAVIDGVNQKAIKKPKSPTQPIKGPEVLHPINEIPALLTNSLAESTLIAIQVLERCGDQISSWART